MMDFRSALHIAGETNTSRTVVYIVGLDSEEARFGLVAHVGRDDGQQPLVTEARAGETPVPYLRLPGQQVQGMPTASGMIPLSDTTLSRAANHGMQLELCGAGTCYRADVPAGLFLQALVE